MISSVTANVARFRREPEDFWNFSARNYLGDTTTRLYDSLPDNRTNGTESILQLIAESALSRRDSLSVLIPITVLYFVMLFTGLIGNIATCVVIARNKSMHTATNYYLCSLAMSDLLLLLSGLPMEMWIIWSYPYIFGETFCILQSFAAETSANATVLTITAFTVERYVAICHPFISHTMSKLSRAVKFIVAIWLLALCLAVPQAIQFGIMYNYVDNTTVIQDSARCSMKWVLVEHAFEISSFLFFVLPVTIIIVLYVLIAIKLRNSSMLTKNINGSHVRGILNHVDSAKRRKENAQRNVIRMLIAVVVTFIICWAPFHAQRLLAVYAKSRTENQPMEEFHTLQSIYEVLTYVSGVFYYLSTTVNPILYQIMSRKFRQAFKSMLPKWYIKKCLSRQESRQPTYSSLMRCQKSTRHRFDGTQHATFVVDDDDDDDEQQRLTHIALTDIMASYEAEELAKKSNGFFAQQRPDSPTPREQPGNARYERDTISNSSLKDLEETEFTGTELACYMTTRQYWKGA